MKILVVAFASASDALGASETTVELASGASLSDLRTLLVREHPTLEQLWPRLAVAVDGVLTRKDTPLLDGAEVALLPPVSGGEPPPSVRISEDAIEAEKLLDAVQSPQMGASVLFLGAVRNHHQGQSVEGLTYTAYRSMAENTLQQIIEELEGETVRIAVHHRIGHLEPGTASVGIAVAAPHREAAYSVNRLVLERLKREVPVWKREHYSDGRSRWREEESLLETV